MTWLIVALCLFVAFIFSGIEAGILSVSRVRLKHRVNGELQTLKCGTAVHLERHRALPRQPVERGIYSASTPKAFAPVAF